MANSWQQAKEFDRAISALETASKLDDKGSLYQQLGSIYASQEQWNEAVISLNKAISKGGLKKPGSTYLLLGISYYELKKTDQARKVFLQAASYSRAKKEANQWLEYMTSSEKKG